MFSDIKTVYCIWIIMVLYSIHHDVLIQGRYIIELAPNKTRFPSDFLCKSPYENKKLYKNCKPVGKDNFPATNAICDCIYCTEQMHLICYDGSWYDHNVNICGSALNYGVCGPCYGNETIPDNIKCDTNGNFIQRFKCYCRNNCKETVLKCGANGKWETPECNDLPVVERKSQKVTAEITNDSYTFSCATGYSMIKSGYAKCNDGELDKKYPFCVRQKESKNEETTIEIMTSSTLNSTTESILLRKEENENNITLNFDNDTDQFNLTTDEVQHYSPNTKDYYIIFINLAAFLLLIAFIILIIVGCCKKSGIIPKKSSQTAAKRQSRVQ